MLAHTLHDSLYIDCSTIKPTKTHLGSSSVAKNKNIYTLGVKAMQSNLVRQMGGIKQVAQMGHPTKGRVGNGCGSKHLPCT